MLGACGVPAPQLLEPGPLRWWPHFLTSFTKPWQPHTRADIEAALSASGRGPRDSSTSSSQKPAPGLLARLCVDKLRRLVRAFQRRVRPVAGAAPLELHVRLRAGASRGCGDALTFCAYDGLRLDWPPASGGDGGGDQEAAARFDVVDMGGMAADFGGVLPALLCAAPRLAQRPGARLRVQLGLWGVCARDLAQHLWEQ